MSRIGGGGGGGGGGVALTTDRCMHNELQDDLFGMLASIVHNWYSSRDLLLAEHGVLTCSHELPLFCYLHCNW